ncbi:MAG TPA: hypothetical protein VH165_09435 [Kofleriaceae bacterium]|nr:hypothetical protein [Kofleriaceae bacterium]
MLGVGALVRDPDPAVCEAALDQDTALALIDDADPFVARAAIEVLVSAFCTGARGRVCCRVRRSPRRCMR